MAVLLFILGLGVSMVKPALCDHVWAKIINPQRMREGYSTHCVCLWCVCVSLSTLEATLIYSANNGH